MRNNKQFKMYLKMCLIHKCCSINIWFLPLIWIFSCSPKGLSHERLLIYLSNQKKIYIYITKVLCPSPVSLIFLSFGFKIFQRKLYPQKAIMKQKMRIIMILIISTQRSLLRVWEKYVEKNRYLDYYNYSCFYWD